VTDPAVAVTAAQARPGRLGLALLRRDPATLFAAFVLLHIAIWTLLPTLFDRAGPIDTLEGLAWGREWQLGYYKHPPLQAWLLQVATLTLGRHLWACYLLSQLAVAASLWAIWRLGRLIVRPAEALIAVLLLDGTIYFNRLSAEFNPNVAQLPFWCLACWSFYRASRFGRAADWLLLGLWLALAGYAKYSSVLLLPPMVAFLLLEPTARRHWRSAWPYLGAALSLLLLAPHLWWLTRHGFAPVLYPVAEARPSARLVSRIVEPLHFVNAQLVKILPALGLAALLCWRAGRPDGTAARPAAFDRRFVAVMALGPLATALALSMAGGLSFHNNWGYPLWSLAGLFVVTNLAPAPAAASVRRFAIAWCCWAALLPLYCAAVLASAPYLEAAGWAEAVGRLGRSTLYQMVYPAFPAAEMAQTLTAAWRAKVGTPLRIVGGSTWMSGTIGFHSPDRPSVLIDGNRATSPWISDAELRRDGILVAFDPFELRRSKARELHDRFPGIEMQPPLILPLDTGANLPHVEIDWGIVYPQAAPR
jgi:4-amino-4-deoxy-L-arabinose transferase-like glycosyltransferase